MSSVQYLEVDNLGLLLEYTRLSQRTLSSMALRLCLPSVPLRPHLLECLFELNALGSR